MTSEQSFEEVVGNLKQNKHYSRGIMHKVMIIKKITSSFL